MSTIGWRGFEIPGSPEDEDGAWSLEYADGYIGVTCAEEDSPAWSAVIECGQLTGEGSGDDATAALDCALADLRSGVAYHADLLREHFEGP